MAERTNQRRRGRAGGAVFTWLHVLVPPCFQASSVGETAPGQRSAAKPGNKLAQPPVAASGRASHRLVSLNCRPASRLSLLLVLERVKLVKFG